jgi:hypothetical protein
MKKACLSVLLVMCFIATACDDLSEESGVQVINEETYKTVGAGVAAKDWSENYDCSNFSTQFYQNCYKAGLPCRIRFGKSGGEGAPEDHAWNSVKINGQWLDWEPQINSIFSGHKQIKTTLESTWGNFYKEDISRIIYEAIGRYVPSSVIDNYEIDDHWDKDSPFYKYFLPLAYCLSNDPSAEGLVQWLQPEIPDNNSGDVYIFEEKYLFFFFKYQNKYYGIEHLENNDPLEGRSAAERGRPLLKEIIVSNPEFTRLDVNLRY